MLYGFTVFIDKEHRISFFKSIASRLRPEGLLASADLAGEVGSSEYNVLLKAWASMRNGEKAPPDEIERTHASWVKDVGILPPKEVEEIIKIGGFEQPVQFYQAGFAHAWVSKRSKNAV